MIDWLKKRAKERTTYIGLLTTIAAVYTGPYAGVVGQLTSTLIAAIGGALVAHKSSGGNDG